MPMLTRKMGNSEFFAKNVGLGFETLSAQYATDLW